MCWIQNSRCASGGRTAIHAAAGLRTHGFGLVLSHCDFGPIRGHLHCQTGVKTVGLRLTCEGAKEHHDKQNKESADPQQHARRVALTDAALCRLVLQCCMCSAVNQSPAPFDKRRICLITWELVDGECKTT